MKQYEFDMIPVPREALAAAGISRIATVEAFADGKSLVIRRVPDEDFCDTFNEDCEGCPYCCPSCGECLKEQLCAEGDGGHE